MHVNSNRERETKQKRREREKNSIREHMPSITKILNIN